MTSKTKKSMIKENEEIPIKAPLNPSTPYVSGSAYDMYLTASGRLFNGNKAPDKKKSGNIIKLTIKLNP